MVKFNGNPDEVQAEVALVIVLEQYYERKIGIGLVLEVAGHFFQQRSPMGIMALIGEHRLRNHHPPVIQFDSEDPHRQDTV